MVDQHPNENTWQTAEQIEEIDFQKYWLVLRRHWLPAVAVFGVTVGLALLIALKENQTYQAEGKIRFKSDRAAALTGLEQDLGQVEVLNLRSEPEALLETQTEIVKSLPVMKEAILALGMTDEEGRPVDPQYLLRKIDVNTVSGTELLQITAESEDPEESAAIVNHVIQAYRQKNIENNREETLAARLFIEGQLPQLEASVLQAEEALQQFKDKNNVVILEQEASDALSVLSDLNQQVEQLQAELADVVAKFNELQGQLGVTVSEGIYLSTLSQSVGVQAALTDVQTRQAELSELQSRYSENHPEAQIAKRRLAEAEVLLNRRIQEVTDQQLSIPVDQIDIGWLQLGSLQQDLIGELTRLNVERIGLINRLAELTQTRDRYLTQKVTLPELEKIQRQLERQLQASETTYETLLIQLQEIRVVENQNVGNVQVVSFAEVPDNPERSNRKLYLAVGGTMGLLLGIATAFLLDLLDSSIKTIKEAKALFGYTVLGVIPLIKEPRQHAMEASTDTSLPRLLVHQPEYAGVREAYQILQTNLKFLQSETELKMVVVTSAVPGEGKSEVSANLAAVLAQAERRVLLIDADMRYPRQHHALKVLNQVGLSHVITGQLSLQDCIQPVTDNLDVLTAGAVPLNPVNLLDSRRMRFLLQDASKHYEMVIIDAPSLAGYADAFILGKMADGILLVVRPGVVSHTEGRIAKDLLVQSQQSMLGIVINGINPENEPDTRFYWRQSTYYPETTPALYAENKRKWRNAAKSCQLGVLLI